jgi:hypothetical protein
MAYILLSPLSTASNNIDNNFYGMVKMTEHQFLNVFRDPRGGWIARRLLGST